jgi:hypothetical protein
MNMAPSIPTYPIFFPHRVDRYLNANALAEVWRIMHMKTPDACKIQVLTYEVNTC